MENNLNHEIKIDISVNQVMEAREKVMNYYEKMGFGKHNVDFYGTPPVMPADVKSAWDTVQAFQEQVQSQRIRMS